MQITHQNPKSVVAKCQTLCKYSVREVFFGFAGHLEFFARHLIEFNSSSSPDILKIRRTCPASPANFAYTVSIPLIKFTLASLISQ